jgi:hypothetical protein
MAEINVNLQTASSTANDRWNRVLDGARLCRRPAAAMRTLLWLTLRAQLRSEESRSQAFAVGLVVAVPTAQGGVAGVGEKKWQRRRFNVAVAKHHVGRLFDGERFLF